jgi:signal peptidase I
MTVVKRVIAVAGETVDVRSDGRIFIDGDILEEPYVREHSYGDYCTVEFPYYVSEGRVFVLGDNRAVSVDSRAKEIGSIDIESQFVGKALIRVWPLKRIGIIKGYS